MTVVYEYPPAKFFFYHRFLASILWFFCVLAFASSVGELAFWVHQWLPFSILDERISLLGAQKLNVWGDFFLICSILYFIPKFLKFMIFFPMDLFSQEQCYDGIIEAIEFEHKKAKLFCSNNVVLRVPLKVCQVLQIKKHYRMNYTGKFKTVKKISSL